MPRHDERNESLRRLIEPLRGPLLAYCRRALWNPSDLEDALQSILMTAVEKFEQYEMGTDFRAWIFRISANHISNFNRRSHQEHLRVVDAEPEELDIVAELQREYAYDELLRHPERVLDHVGDEVTLALLNLSEPERAVFLLKSIGDLTCREIAVILDMPMGSVMGYLARARGKLRSQLCEYAKKYGFLSDQVTEEPAQ